MAALAVLLVASLRPSLFRLATMLGAVGVFSRQEELFSRGFSKKSGSFNSGGLSGIAESFWLECKESSTTGVLDTAPARAKGTATPTVESRASSAYTDIFDESTGLSTITQVSSNQLRYAKRKEASGNECLGGYLPEEEGTNHHVYSEDMTRAGTYNLARASITDASSDLPDAGSASNDVVHEDNTAAQTHFWQSSTIACTLNQVLTFSVFAKAINRDWICLRFNDLNGLFPQAFFNVSTGAVGTIAQDTTDLVAYMEGPFYGSFYRCVIACTAPATDDFNPTMFICDADNSNSFNGLDQDSVFNWGVMVERNASGSTLRASSYIKTTAATATRLKDQLQYKGDDGNLGGDGSDQQGAMRFKVLSPNVDSAAQRNYVEISDGGSADERILLYHSGSDDIPRVLVREAAATQVNNVASTDVIDGEIHTVGAIWEANNSGIFVDGAEEGTRDTSCTIPDDLDEIDIGQSSNATAQPGCIISDIRVYDRADKRRAV
jgi:hypothetical protein